MLTSAQNLLTIAAELLLSGSVALYGYLFVQGLVNRSHKPAQPVAKPIPPVAPSYPLPKPAPAAVVINAVTEVDTPSCLLPCPAPATPDEATSAVVPAKDGAIVLADKPGAIELVTTLVEVLPVQTESIPQPAVVQQQQAIVLATAPAAIVPTRIQSPKPSPQAAAVTLAAHLGVSLPVLVTPPTGAIVLANHFATVFAATLTPKPLHPDYTSMSDLDLIAAAKAAQFPTAKKWAKNRKLRSGEKQRAIQFLQQQHQAIASRCGGA